MIWFVQLMVLKRLSFFPSHCDTYLKFLEEADSEPLYEEVILTTCESFKILLRSTATELGIWEGVDDYDHTIHCTGLGALQKQSHISTSKLLGYGLTQFLSEIYSMPGLQTSLPSSIEGLFEIFGVMGPVQPTSLLAELSKKEDGNPDFIDKKPSITWEAHDQHLSTAIDKIKEIVIINTGLHPRLSCHSDSPSVLQLAVLQSLKTVVPDLVKMSVNVALQNTKAHVLMAFPLGTSDLLRNDAAYKMVTSFAQNYAKKLCKEPLRGWMYSLLHGSLQQLSIQYETRCTIVGSIISDNFELICTGIQDMARTEVARDIKAQVRSWIYPSKDEMNIMAIKKEFKAGISVSEMKDLLDSRYGFVGEKSEALLEAIFSGVEKGFVKVLEENKSYFAAIMEPMSQGFLLQAIGNYSNKRDSVSFKEELPRVFECLLTAPTLVDSHDIIVFNGKLENQITASTSIRQSVKNLLNRLQGLQGDTVEDRNTWIV